MQQTQDFPDRLIYVNRAPFALVLPDEVVDSLNNGARPAGIGHHIDQQLVQHARFQ